VILKYIDGGKVYETKEGATGEPNTATATSVSNGKRRGADDEDESDPDDDLPLVKRVRKETTTLSTAVGSTSGQPNSAPTVPDAAASVIAEIIEVFGRGPSKAPKAPNLSATAIHMNEADGDPTAAPTTSNPPLLRMANSQIEKEDTAALVPDEKQKQRATRDGMLRPALVLIGCARLRR
jgi:hypothetical protein